MAEVETHGEAAEEGGALAPEEAAEPVAHEHIEGIAAGVAAGAHLPPKATAAAVQVNAVGLGGEAADVFLGEGGFEKFGGLHHDAFGNGIGQEDSVALEAGWEGAACGTGAGEGGAAGLRRARRLRRGRFLPG